MATVKVRIEEDSMGFDVQVPLEPLAALILGIQGSLVNQQTIRKLAKEIEAAGTVTNGERFGRKSDV